ncbi:uncharacterized protein LTR77_010029 [Saxophila tyrrhenica]|uniref:Uncharacterized protein n=1 Tax=Saxophila tyrrhenica TaxID=1690608 RepID=A0AAV9P0J2_9PEZI|nr:hypothetical protein LTR77_010029 [Saxophila tyrrhenica]
MRFSITAIIAFLATVHASILSDDVTIHEDGTLQENNATHTQLMVQKLYPAQVQILDNFNLRYATIYFTGYFVFTGGAQVVTAMDKCEGLNGVADGIKCVISGTVAAIGNIGTFLVGGYQGNGHMAWISNVARQAGFAPGNQKRDDIMVRQSCPAVNPFISSSTWPDGDGGIKISAKLGCFNLGEDDIPKLQNLISKLPQMMADKGYWQAEGTFYDPTQPNGNTALLRIHMGIWNSHPTNCPAPITGSGCAF